MGRNTLISKASADTMLGLVQGFVKSDGSISVAGDTLVRTNSAETRPNVTHEQAVTTTPIYGGAAFCFEAASGYRVMVIALYDAATGECIQYNPYNLNFQMAFSNRGRVESMVVHKSQYVRLTLINVDPPETNDYTPYNTPAGNVSPSDNVIGSFWRINPMYYERMASTRTGYANIRYRAKQLANITWCPLVKMELGGDYGAQDNWYLAGKTYMGVPYSEAGVQDKFLGVTVSLRQFFTALQNKRSVAYTENPRSTTEHPNGVSEYGISYNVSSSLKSSENYFGTVCSAFLVYVLGLKGMYSAAQFGSLGYSSVTVERESDCADLRPGDIMQSENHVRIIIDIWKDASGAVHYIEVIESNSATVLTRLMTPAAFIDFMGSMTVLRPTTLPNVAVEDTPWIWQEPMDDVEPAPTIDADICTFAGDYASFAKGDIIYLNVNRDHGRYENVTLERHNGTEYVLAETLSLGNFPSVQPDEDDVVDLSLTSLNLPVGKYRAKAVGDGTASGYTYFEVLGGDITCHEVESGNNIRLENMNGDPESVQMVWNNSGYLDNKNHVATLNAEEKERGMFRFGYAHGTGTLVRLTVKGDYGKVGIDFSKEAKTNYLTRSSNKGSVSSGGFNGSGTIISWEGFNVSKVIACYPGYLYRYAFVRGSTVTAERVAFYDVPLANIDNMTQAQINAMVPIAIRSFPLNGDTVGTFRMHDFIAPAGATCMRISYLTAHTYRSVVWLAMPGVVATPVIYGASSKLFIECDTSGASIYYTTDGSTPTTSSTLYEGPVAMQSGDNWTVKAIAVKTGMADSVVASETVAYNPDPPAGE